MLAFMPIHIHRSLLLAQVALLLCVFRSKPSDYHVLGSMAPVMRIEPNGKQALLMFDNARRDLEENGWLTFVQQFEGFNLCVA